MMDLLHLSLLVLLVPLCQGGGMLYSEIRFGMIVCEDIFDEIPECDATTKQTTECITMISVIDCSTAQNTTSDCEELTEDPTDCKPPTIPTITDVQPTKVSENTEHTSSLSSVTDTGRTIVRDNTTSNTISQTLFTVSRSTSELTGSETTVTQHTPFTLSNSVTTTVPDTSSSYTGKTTVIDSQTTIEHATPTTGNDSYTTIVRYSSDSPTGKTTIDNSWTTPPQHSDTTIERDTPSTPTRKTTTDDSRTTPQHVSDTTEEVNISISSTGKTTIDNSWTTPQHHSDTTVEHHTPSSPTGKTTTDDSRTTPQHVSDTTEEVKASISPTGKTTIIDSHTAPQRFSDTTILLNTASSATSITTADGSYTTSQHLSGPTVEPPTGKTTTNDSLTTAELLSDATSVLNNTNSPTGKTTIENSQATPELNSSLSSVTQITHTTVKNTDATEVVPTTSSHTTERTITGNETIPLTGLTTISTNQTSGMTQGETSKEDTDPTSSGRITTEEPCDEKICPCPTHFYGKNCRFIYSEIILDFVIAKVEISVHVQNEEFNSSLNNPLSSEYQDFHDRFLNEMEYIYKRTLPRFKEIRIVSFRQGSIIVDHEVQLMVDYGNYLKETQLAESQLRATLTEMNCSSNRTGRLCFNGTKTTIKTRYIKDSDLCLEEESIPQDMRHYFYGLNMSRALLCVSECSSRHHSPIDCQWGQCLVVQDTGPHCYCDTSDQFWYTGDRCQTPVSKPGVYGGVTVGLIVLVIIIVILVVALCRRRYRADEDLLVDTEPQHHRFGWTRDYKVHGRLVNPDTDKMMFGPRGTFKLTMENVNPGAQLSLPRAQRPK